MGVVYEAFDRERGQTLALKTLTHFDPAALYRFKQEFRAIADVHHVNLVRLHELVAESDHAFFTMELVEGVDFLAYTRADPESRKPGAGSPGSASPADVQKLRVSLRQLAEAVQAVHGAGKLHRDIKPPNILVTADGRVVLLDFGVATDLARRGDGATEDLGVVGTISYMAPEQALDEAPTPAGDWYSVGVLLFEALTGRSPFEGDAMAVLSMKNTVDARPPSELCPDVPPDLDALCSMLLARDPEKRPPGTEVLRRLGATRSSRPFASPLPVADADRSAMLVGRESELGALRAAFDAMVSGRSMTVRLGGASGMGKSAIVGSFLDGLSERGEALVLRGRAYERESVPYKAFDSVVDAVSRHLLQNEEAGEPLNLPRDIDLLARLFPVLRRVPSIGVGSADAIVDPHLVRLRAFVALRELLDGLRKLRPVVLSLTTCTGGTSTAHRSCSSSCARRPRRRSCSS